MSEKMAQRVSGRSSTGEPAVDGDGFVAISRFVVRNGMTEEVKQAFRARARLVDEEQGFVALRVLSPADNPAEIWLLTFWTDAASFERWHASHAYKASHRGIPKGLKLVPRETWLRHFDWIAS